MPGWARPGRWTAGGRRLAARPDGHRLLVGCSNERMGKDKLTVVQTLATPKRSRTMTLDPKTHRLYVAAAEFAPAATGPDGKPQRPQVVPGSFKVVVYEKETK